MIDTVVSLYSTTIAVKVTFVLDVAASPCSLTRLVRE